jgi:hypothetical protein
MKQNCRQPEPQRIDVRGIEVIGKEREKKDWKGVGDLGKVQEGKKAEKDKKRKGRLGLWQGMRPIFTANHPPRGPTRSPPPQARPKRTLCVATGYRDTLRGEELLEEE